MIKKEITMNDGKKYIIGFEDIKSDHSFKCIHCHILKKTLFGYKKIYSKLHGKGLCPNYQEIALWTILDYERELEQKQALLSVNWS